MQQKITMSTELIIGTMIIFLISELMIIINDHYNRLFYNTLSRFHLIKFQSILPKLSENSFNITIKSVCLHLNMMIMNAGYWIHVHYVGLSHSQLHTLFIGH